MKVMIVGGGNLGYGLAELLVKEKHDVVIVEILDIIPNTEGRVARIPGIGQLAYDSHYDDFPSVARSKWIELFRMLHRLCMRVGWHAMPCPVKAV